MAFPPFTCLDVDGEPRVEFSDAGEIVVFTLKVRKLSSPPGNIGDGRQIHVLPFHSTVLDACTLQQ